MILKLTILPGDGIGPEVTEQAVLVLQAVVGGFGHRLELQHKLIGAAALAAVNDPLPAETIQACLSSSAVLMGAVGSPGFDHYLIICVPRLACCAFGASWVRLLICVPPGFLRRSKIVRLCALRSCAAWTY